MRLILASFLADKSKNYLCPLKYSTQCDSYIQNTLQRLIYQNLKVLNYTTTNINYTKR